MYKLDYFKDNSTKTYNTLDISVQIFELKILMTINYLNT